jgi:hypothetical protein
VPAGSTPTSHILKPAVAGFDDHDLNEHLCLDAGRRAGLLAARTAVARFGAQTAVVVSRYDRVERTGEITRVHPPSRPPRGPRRGPGRALPRAAVIYDFTVSTVSIGSREAISARRSSQCGGMHMCVPSSSSASSIVKPASVE